VKPEKILKNIKDTYRGFKSYSDKGTVDIVHAVGKKSMEFQTYFIRPSKIRFEWRSARPESGNNQSGDKHLIWSNGKKTYAWFHNKLEDTELRKAVALCTGVSSGSVHVILKLLVPDQISVNQAWYQMGDAKVLEDDEEVNGFRCYHIKGTSVKEDDTECWISRDDQVVRRLSRKTEISAEEANKMLGTAVDLLHKMSEFNQMFTSSTDVLKKMEAASEQLPRQMKTDLCYTTVYNYKQVTTNDALSEELFSVDPAGLTSKV